MFSDTGLDLYNRTMPFTTQGLSLVSHANARRNPYFIAHKSLTRNHPARVLYRREPFYIRSVHDSNDSKANFGGDKIPAEAMPNISKRFPFLPALMQATYGTKEAPVFEAVAAE